MRRRYWAGGAALAAVVAVAAGAGVVGWDPLILPGPHRVEVFGLDLKIPASGKRPLTGMCDADSYYVQEGDRAWCISPAGPLGTVHSTLDGDRITVPAEDVPRLRALATDGSTLVLESAGMPVALIPVGDLTDGQPVSVPKLT